MSASDLAPLPFWLNGRGRRPLCDVPWLGTSVVLSDGNVNFCCFSDAVVGNVNRQPFEEIWNGPTMQGIRHALAAHRLPRECQSPSCPIYRGDRLHYLFERMDGPPGVAVGAAAGIGGTLRERLAGSSLEVTSPLRPTETLRVALDLQYRGACVAVDLLLGIMSPDSSVRFLPGLWEFPAPAMTRVELMEPSSRLVAAEIVNPFEQPGTYQVCAALVNAGSNPNIISSYCWASAGELVVIS